MANPPGGSRRGKNDIAPIIRGWSAAGIRKLAQRNNQTPAELFADWFAKDPAGMLRAVSRYTVREKEISGTVKHDHKLTVEPVSDTASWIEGLLGESAEGEIAESLPPRSVLPAAVRTSEAGH